ncbi:hypothetical protein F4814DRAFT_401815 [Daldinia grandis]|nr:hypothetical protein F4814DRAFT_401815 [Daldinia grandis]
MAHRLAQTRGLFFWLLLLLLLAVFSFLFFCFYSCDHAGCPRCVGSQPRSRRRLTKIAHTHAHTFFCFFFLVSVCMFLTLILRIVCYHGVAVPMEGTYEASWTSHITYLLT